MKNIIKSIMMIITIIILTSCNKDETGNGKLSIHFENTFQESEIVFNEPTTETSNHEVLKISTVKYVVSNIILTNYDNSTLTCTGNYIIDESSDTNINLTDIPFGNYTNVKFTIQSLSFEGTFTILPTGLTDEPFIINTTNYKEVSLSLLPTKAFVRSNITPGIHMNVELSKSIQGINLTNPNLNVVTTNTPTMFSVEHIHNDPN
jgi:hypothetical protein